MVVVLQSGLRPWDVVHLWLVLAVSVDVGVHGGSLIVGSQLLVVATWTEHDLAVL